MKLNNIFPNSKVASIGYLLGKNFNIETEIDLFAPISDYMTIDVDFTDNPIVPDEIFITEPIKITISDFKFKFNKMYITLVYYVLDEHGKSSIDNPPIIKTKTVELEEGENVINFSEVSAGIVYLKNICQLNIKNYNKN